MLQISAKDILYDDSACANIYIQMRGFLHGNPIRNEVDIEDTLCTTKIPHQKSNTSITSFAIDSHMNHILLKVSLALVIFFHVLLNSSKMTGFYSTLWGSTNGVQKSTMEHWHHKSQKSQCFGTACFSFHRISQHGLKPSCKSIKLQSHHPSDFSEKNSIDSILLGGWGH